MSKSYYFAYGSNMKSKQMKERCPESVYAGIGTLHGYRLTERKYADIDKATKECVHGVIYEVTDTDLENLDCYEGIHSNAYRRIILNIECNGKTIPAFVYEMTEETKEKREGISYSDEYRKKCSDGAREHGVPDAFIKE